MLKNILEKVQTRGWYSQRRPYFMQTKGTGLLSPQDKPSGMMLTLFKYIKDLGVRGKINEQNKPS